MPVAMSRENGSSKASLTLVQLFVCGHVYSWELLQVCNNLVLGVSMAAVAEGLALGSKLGLDPKLLSDIFNSSSARCWSSDSYNPCPVQLLCSVIVMSACIKCWFQD